MNKRVILAVGAHPDDTDFTASGTIAKWIEEGNTDCYYLICTDGSRGSSDPKMTHKRLSNIRQKEQLAAAKILGVKEVFFLNHVDTQLVADLKLKEEIVYYIRKLKPEIVITMNPTFYYTTHTQWSDRGFVNHTDHRAVALATMDTCFPLARDRLTFPEHEKQGLSPHRVDELWFTSFEKADHLVDVTSVFEKKLRALAMHASQFDDFPAVKKRVISRAISFAKDEEYEFAESFVRLKLP